MAETNQLRSLPAVHEIVNRLEHLTNRFPRHLIVTEVRNAISGMRVELQSNPDAALGPVEERVEKTLAALEFPSLRRVINATGVVLHTNLGRAPLGDFHPVPGYSNLEFDLKTGKRGKRDIHISKLLERLLGKPAIAVNNNAAAVYLVLNELAAGGEVIVSRGELIEIGDGFRIPDIMACSGAILREVGTTNKTHIDDFRQAFTDRTRLVLRVHHSNFRITGFTDRPTRRQLTALGRERGVPVYEDLGSGCVIDLRQYGIKEPLPTDSLRDGFDLVSFSGDKLLGGPQAGIIAGNQELVSRLRRNPMFRTLRLDKLIHQTLEATLRELLLERYDRIPALRMIVQSTERIHERAQAILGKIPELNAELKKGISLIGGGSTPDQSIPTWLITISSGNVIAMQKQLRSGEPPVIARIEDDRLLLDLRTVFPEDENCLVAALQALS